MEHQQSSGRRRRRKRGWLRSHSEAFLARLGDQGYRLSTVRHYERVVECFCAEFTSRKLHAGNVCERSIARVQEAVLQAEVPSSRRWTKHCLSRLLDYLAADGGLVREPPVAVPASAMDILKEEYAVWLRRERGLSEATVRRYLPCLERFMASQFGNEPGDLNSIALSDVLAFLYRGTAGAQSRRDLQLPLHLRNLFRFLFWSGRIRHDLSDSIPAIARPKATNLKRHLDAGEVHRLLEAVRTDDAIGRRDYAILLLSARLGLRAQELVAIQLEDLDWRAGEILIRGKGLQRDRMPLPVDVGEAVAAWLRDGRAGDSRALFVSVRPPFRPFKSGQIVNKVLCKAFQKAGLHSPQRRLGAHVLRHSLAVDLLRAGASLGEVGDVLRHRSHASTTTYARHDLEALRSLARNWPAAEGIA